MNQERIYTVSGNSVSWNDATIITNDEWGIPDKVLYDQIKRNAGVGEDEGLTIGSARNVGYINAQISVKDYAGLSVFCPNLWQISVTTYEASEDHWEEASNSFFEEAGKLKNLTQLNTYNVYFNQNQIEKLAGLTNLQQLNLMLQDGSVDLSPIAGLEQLSFLYLQIDGSGFVPQEQPAEVKKKVSNLYITLNDSADDNTRADYDLTGYDSLSNLSISGYGIGSVEGYQDLSNLTNLNVTNYSNTEKTKIGTSFPASLSWLTLQNVELNTITETNIPELAKLNGLTLSGAGLTDAGGIEKLTGLFSLNLGNNRLEAIPNLSGIEGLSTNLSADSESFYFVTKLNLGGNRLTKDAIVGNVPEVFSNNAAWLSQMTKVYINGNSCYSSLTAEELEALINGTSLNANVAEYGQIEISPALVEKLKEGTINVQIQFYGEDGHRVRVNLGNSYGYPTLTDSVNIIDSLYYTGDGSEAAKISSLFPEAGTADVIRVFRNTDIQTESKIPVSYSIPVSEAGKYSLYFFDEATGKVELITTRNYSSLSGTGSFWFDNCTSSYDSASQTWIYSYPENLNYSASKGFYFVLRSNDYILSADGTSFVDGSAVITNDENGIPDSELYNYLLRDVAGGDNILTVSEAYAKTYLSLPLSVKDYKGLAEYFPNLTSINFTTYNSYTGTSISESNWSAAADSFFAEYEKLQKVESVEWMRVEDESQLSKILQNPRLNYLRMYLYTKISDFTALENSSVERLGFEVRGNYLLPQLLPDSIKGKVEYFSLSLGDGYNTAESVDIDVTGFGKLTRLYLYGYGLNSVRGYKDLPLTSLSISKSFNSSNAKESFRLEEALPQTLTSLYLYNVQIDGIKEAGISEMTDLYELRLDRCGLTSIEGVENLSELRMLEFEYNKVTDLAPLKDLTSLSYLFADNNEITDASALAGLTGLTQLWIQNNRIEVLPDLTGLENLGSNNYYRGSSNYSDLVNQINLSGNLLTESAISGKLPDKFTGNAVWMLYSTTKHRGDYACYDSLTASQFAMALNQGNSGSSYRNIYVADDGQIEITKGLMEEMKSSGNRIFLYFIDESGKITAQYYLGDRYGYPELTDTVILKKTAVSYEVSDEDKAKISALFESFEEKPEISYYKFLNSNGVAEIAGYQMLQAPKADQSYRIYFYDYEKQKAEVVSQSYGYHYVRSDESSDIVMTVSNFTTTRTGDNTYKVTLLTNTAYNADKGVYFFVPYQFELPSRVLFTEDGSTEKVIEVVEGGSVPSTVKADEVVSAEYAKDSLLAKLDDSETYGKASITTTQDDTVTLTKDVFEKASSTGKNLSVSVVNDDNEKVYEWSFNSGDLDSSKFVDLDLTVKFDTEKKEAIQNLTNQTDAFYMSFSHHGDLPAPATMTVYVGSQYKDGEKVYLYYFNEESNVIESIGGEGLTVTNGYVTYTITHCSEYFLSKATPNDLGISTGNNNSGSDGGDGSLNDNGKEENVVATTENTLRLSPATGDRLEKAFPYFVWIFMSGAALVGFCLFCMRRKNEEK